VGLHLLGENGVTLDYQSLQLALAWMESEKPRVASGQLTLINFWPSESRGKLASSRP
jgi:hypothetical protein